MVIVLSFKEKLDAEPFTRRASAYDNDISALTLHHVSESKSQPQGPSHANPNWGRRRCLTTMKTFEQNVVKVSRTWVAVALQV